MTLQLNFGAVARTFVDARRSSSVVVDYPGAMPENFTEAYTIQDDAISLTGQKVGGWKVGRVPDHLVAQYGTNRLAGPIFSDMIVESVANGAPQMPVLEGFAAVEAELMLRICKTPPSNVDIVSIKDSIDEVRFGLEIASSPFPGINDHGPAVTISDFGNNFGLVLGPEITDWRDRDLLSAAVEMQLDGEVIGTGRLQNMLDGPFGSAAFLSNLLASRGIELKAGTWISTGAITGVHKITPGQSAHAVFDDKFEVSCCTRLYSPERHAGEGE